jgi:hypothetical protein
MPILSCLTANSKIPVSKPKRKCLSIFKTIFFMLLAPLTFSRCGFLTLTHAWSTRKVWFQKTILHLVRTGLIVKSISCLVKCLFYEIFPVLHISKQSLACIERNIYIIVSHNLHVVIYNYCVLLYLLCSSV